jgi:hypothetical protein
LRAKLAYEQIRRDRRRGAVDVLRETCRALAGHASASKIDDGAGDAPALSAAFLVHRGNLAVFRQQLARLAEASPQMAMLCTGPWPAYSFVSAPANEPAVGSACSRVY